MIKKCVTRALDCFLESKRATVIELFDDLDPEEKETALKEYFRLGPEQQKAFAEFMTNEGNCRAVCAFLCYLAVRADQNEAILVDIKGAIDRYNEDCADAFGSVGPAQTMALLSIEGLLVEIGFKTPCLLLVNSALPKLVFFALVNGISGHKGECGAALVDQFGIGLDKNFRDYEEIVIPDSLVCQLINHPDRSKTNWILTRILFTSIKLSDGAFEKISEHLFRDNDLTPLQLAYINSEEKPNTNRLLRLVEPQFKDSVQMGKPEYLYLYAALRLRSYEEHFLATNAIMTVCVSDDPCEVAVSLTQIDLNSWATMFNAGSMLGFSSGVTPTTAFCECLVEFLMGDDPCLFYAASYCARDLWCIGQFDNALLGRSEIVRKALEYLRSPIESIHLAAEGVLGMMPFKTRLPSKFFRRYYSFYHRALRKEIYDPRVVFYFRILTCCGAWRHPGQLVERYAQLYRCCYTAHKEHVGRVEELLLQLTRQELPQIDKSLRQNVATPVEVLKQSLETPTIFDVCYLSTKADSFLKKPDQRLMLTAKEAQAVLSIAMRDWLGFETRHLNRFQIKALLAQSDLPDDVGSFVVLQWFQWLANFDCPEAVRFYVKYHHILDRPAFYPCDAHKSTFTTFGEFLNLNSRVEMAMAEAIMVSKNGTVAQLFASQPYAPASLPESTRKKIAAMLEKRKRELPVAEEILTQWLDLGPDLMSMPAKAWTRFYDDQGVAQLAVEADTQCHEAVLEFGYGANEGVAAAAMRKDPLWSLSYLAANLQNSEVILQALRDGIKKLTAEDD